MNNIKLIPLRDSDREQFILDNQEAFNYGALEEFGRRDAHFEEDEQIISRETIEKYAKLLSARWSEIVGIHDECDIYHEGVNWRDNR